MSTSEQIVSQADHRSKPSSIAYLMLAFFTAAGSVLGLLWVAYEAVVVTAAAIVHVVG